MSSPATRSSTAKSARKISVFLFFWARRNTLRFLDKLMRSPSDVDYFRLGRSAVVILKHPDLVQQLLVADSQFTIKGRTRERAVFFRFLGEGLLTSEGPAHRKQRRLMLPAFHRSRLSGYGNSMVLATLATVSKWQDGEVRDVGADMSGLTLAVVGSTLFSTEVKDTAQDIATAFNQLTINLNRMVFPGAIWLLRLPLPFARRIDEAQKRLDDMVYALIRERRAQGTDTGDLLSMLLLAEDAEKPGEHLSDEEVRDQAMTLFFAGHETTSNALTWTLWLLSQHPEIERRLHAELAEVLEGRPPAFSDVPRLIFTEQIVREVMRLYPPVWTIGRQSTEELTFGDYRAPKGSLLVASQWVIQRDSRWFPDPLIFRPERWTPEFRASLPRFAYFPFGGGPRSCIGENFAWMEFILIIATMAQSWRFTRPLDSPAILPLAKITLHPNQPVRLQLNRR